MRARKKHIPRVEQLLDNWRQRTESVAECRSPWFPPLPVHHSQRDGGSIPPFYFDEAPTSLQSPIKKGPVMEHPYQPPQPDFLASSSSPPSLRSSLFQPQFFDAVSSVTAPIFEPSLPPINMCILCSGTWKLKVLTGLSLLELQYIKGEQNSR